MNGVTGGLPDPRPHFPEDRGGVAILGAGTVAQSAHLPAYDQYGVGVVGVWSRSQATTAHIRERFAFVGRIYDDPEELLADPAVRIVDIATPAAGRLAWVERAVDAGKHVLAQKPLTMDAAELALLPAILERADARGVRVAVNQNGRWAPPWRLATLLARDGAVGDVVGVTHLHDKPLPPLVGTPFDDIEHMLITDYLMHWIDITRCWLEPGSITRVNAFDSRVPGQPAESRNPWSATISMLVDNGATATLRIAGNVQTADPSCPFWIHGTRGTLRGSVLTDSDRLSLDRDGTVVDLPLRGQWFVDGFAGAMGELMTAVAEGRQPEHSAAHAAVSVEVMLAARESARRGGEPVRLETRRGGGAAG
jgi:predicted dehydrogenase